MWGAAAAAHIAAGALCCSLWVRGLAGFEKMFDIGKLYKPQEGYMLNFGKKPEDVQMGEIKMTVEIFAASGIRMEDPQKEPDLTQTGRQVPTAASYP
jgi:hypothetical protein